MNNTGKQTPKNPAIALKQFIIEHRLTTEEHIDHESFSDWEKFCDQRSLTTYIKPPTEDTTFLDIVTDILVSGKNTLSICDGFFTVRAGLMRPLFIPLNAAPFDAFAAGTKHVEYRLYGPRWNERTCLAGRAVTLSRGYGKKNRMGGLIKSFRNMPASMYDDAARQDILSIYGTLDTTIAAIEINLDARPAAP